MPATFRSSGLGLRPVTTMSQPISSRIELVETVQIPQGSRVPRVSTFNKPTHQKPLTEVLPSLSPVRSAREFRPITPQQHINQAADLNRIRSNSILTRNKEKQLEQANFERKQISETRQNRQSRPQYQTSPPSPQQIISEKKIFSQKENQKKATSPIFQNNSERINIKFEEHKLPVRQNDIKKLNQEVHNQRKPDNIKVIDPKPVQKLVQNEQVRNPSQQQRPPIQPQ